MASYALDLAEPPAAVLHCAPAATLVAAMPRDIVLWDAATGAPAGAFVDAAGGPAAEATAACLDDRARKLFVGRADGAVAALNLQNGALMKASTAQVGAGAVTALVYADADRCLLAAAGASLAVYDDEPQGALLDLRAVRHAHAVDIAALALAQPHALVATGDRDGHLRAWDFQDLKLVADAPGAHRAPITAIVAFGARPLLASADAEGRMVVWAIAPGGAAAASRLVAVAALANDYRLPEVYDPEEEAARPMAAATGTAATSADDGGAPLHLRPPSAAAAACRRARAPAAAGTSGGAATDDSALLRIDVRMSALVEQIVDDYEARFHTSPRAGGDDEALQPQAALARMQQRRRRQFRLSMTLGEAGGGSGDSAPPPLPSSQAAAAARRGRLRVRMRTTLVAVTAMAALTDGSGDAGNDAAAAVLLLTADDRGSMRIRDLSGIARRAGLLPLPRERWPAHAPSYTARRRTHRDEAGPVITDVHRFYGEAGGGASADGGGGGAGRSLTAADADRLVDMDRRLRAARPAGAAVPVPAQHESSGDGLTVQLSGYCGVGIADTLRRRSPASQSVMRRAGVLAGVAGAASREAVDAFQARAGGGAQAAAAAAAASTPPVPPTRVPPTVAGDAPTLAEWSAHAASSIASIHIFHLAEPGDAGDTAAAPAATARSLAGLQGMHATTCGADGRVFVWCLRTRERLGELGNTAGDADAIAAGGLRGVPWRLPSQARAAAAARDAEAARILAAIDADAAKGAGAGAAHGLAGDHTAGAPPPAAQADTSAGITVLLASAGAARAPPSADEGMLEPDRLLDDDAEAMLQQLELYAGGDTLAPRRSAGARGGAAAGLAARRRPAAMSSYNPSRSPLTPASVGIALDAESPAAVAAATLGDAAVAVLAMSGYEPAGLAAAGALLRAAPALPPSSRAALASALGRAAATVDAGSHVSSASATSSAVAVTASADVPAIRQGPTTKPLTAAAALALATASRAAQATPATTPQRGAAAAAPYAALGRELAQRQRTSLSGSGAARRRRQDAEEEAAASDAAATTAAAPAGGKTRLAAPQARIRRSAAQLVQPPASAAASAASLAESPLDAIIRRASVATAATMVAEDAQLAGRLHGSERLAAAAAVPAALEARGEEASAAAMPPPPPAPAAESPVAAAGAPSTATPSPAATSAASLPLPAPGVFMPTLFGQYSALEVIKARDIFSECDLARSGEAATAELRTHPFWDRMYGGDGVRAQRVRHALGSVNEAALTLPEFFARVFTGVAGDVLTAMVAWTDAAAGVGLAAVAADEAVPWRQALPAALRDELLATFDALDADGSGTVSVAEIRAALLATPSSRAGGGGGGGGGGNNAADWTAVDVQDVINATDSHGDGEMSLDAFMQLMSDATGRFHRTEGAAARGRR